MRLDFRSHSIERPIFQAVVRYKAQRKDAAKTTES